MKRAEPRLPPAHALGSFLTVDAPGAAVIPPVSRLTEFSHTIASVVAQCAIRQNLNRVEGDVEKLIAEQFWSAEYKTL